ncbi:acyl-CoA dehydrogenase family protein [Amycolatopsis thermoflava]|uniref:acyl-CoA dehydrogenase family protein n=1 Tax=Amycolatopsis thermoflava TaxID=84480 RepID=UPI003824B73D
MDLDFTAEQAEFRDEVRTWLAENAPGETRPHLDAAAMREYDLAWQRTQWEGGWAGIAWPERYGGRGLTLVQQLIWYEEYARAGLPSVDACFVGLNHAGPTLITTATDEQKQFHLPRILRGEDVWCQGFSEPGAGSDLASLSTRAELDGDTYVVSGQKIWTSFAMIADYQELLVRTSHGESKHRGITWLICDMRSPGIEVRPIETIEGGAEFCEVFYDEVRVPVSHVVGQPDEGWRVAMSTLSFERGTAYTASQVRLAELVENLVGLAGERTGADGRPAIADEEIARRLATARAEVAALRAMTYAGICRNLTTAQPGPEGSMLKLYYAEIAKRVARLAMDILGADGVRATSRWDRPFGWSGNYLYSFSASIGGGTSEIQRNIIGDRVLGLPR